MVNSSMTQSNNIYSEPMFDDELDFCSCRNFIENNVHITDVKSEIYDNFRNLKFAVISKKNNTARQDYTTIVVSYCSGSNPIIIVEKNSLSENESKDIHKKMVERYSYIAKIETENIEHIGLYAEKTGYHCVEKCCATCRYARECHGVMICTNYQLYTPRGIINDKNDHPDHHNNVYNSQPPVHMDCIEPQVNPECVCDFWEPILPGFPNGPHHHEYDQYGNWTHNDIKHNGCTKPHDCHKICYVHNTVHPHGMMDGYIYDKNHQRPHKQDNHGKIW